MRKRGSRNPLHGGEHYGRSGVHFRRRADGKVCRDRLSWGGITWKEACDCVGPCRYDAEQQ